MPEADDRPGDARRQVAARIEDARQQAEDAEEAVVVASEARLHALRRQSVAARFQALGEDDPVLLPEHRRELLRSLDGQELGRAIPVEADFANRWELFRARLPYRAHQLALAGAAIVVGITLLLVARARTPEFWVTSRYAEPISATPRTNAGRVAFDQLEPGQRYALGSEGSGTALLRRWVPRTGYATATVPTEWIQRAP